MTTKEAVMEVLGTIDDPELKRSLAELDMVNAIEIDGSTVNVEITLTVPGCPMKTKITDDVANGIKALDGVEEVNVSFGVMTDEQRNNLKTKLGYGPKDREKALEAVTFSKRFIAVASGKGGVGKSTVTTNLAVAAARLGYKVGLLDADVYGFSIPHMLGISGQPVMIDDKIVPLRKGDNIQVVSIGFFVNEDEPVVWRGPMLHKMINQFVNDVMWDDLDFFFMDLPPGTGDVTITVAQAIPATEIIVVTTPQATATHVAGRVAGMAEKTNLKVLGVIENMAYFETNGNREYIFGKDGGKQLAEKLGVKLLGEVPLMTSIREGADNGKPVASDGDEDQIKLFEEIVKQL